MKTEPVAPLKVTLDRIDPPVMRRFVVPLSIRLDRLHLAIQVAMGWTNSHLWEFRARDCGWGIPDPDHHQFDGPADARKAKLITIMRDTGARTIKYIYDFGDGWDHTIKIQATRDMPIGLDYPLFLEAVGACPPEDVGGPPGYTDFLADPEQRGEFDPARVDKRAIDAGLDALAAKWRRKPRLKTASTKR